MRAFRRIPTAYGQYPAYGPYPPTYVSHSKAVTHGSGWTRTHVRSVSSGTGIHSSIPTSSDPPPTDRCALAPTITQLKRLAAARGIPYIGFGFLDNFLMILFGDFIDGTMCVYFGFSTMAAAALGNTLSDVAGVFSSGVIEDYARSRGFEVPRLSNEQLDLQVTKLYSFGGQTIGIVLGCLLGMMPLLWLDPEEANREKKKKKREAIFSTVLQQVKEILKAEASVLLFLDEDKKELRTVATGSLPAFSSKVEEGIMGYVVQTGKYVNIFDISKTHFYDPERHTNYQGTGLNVKSVLCMPVYGDVLADNDSGSINEPWKRYNLLGVIEVINKKSGMFTRKDEEVLTAICSNVSIALSDEEASFEKVISTCHSLMNQRAGIHVEMAVTQRNCQLFIQAMDDLNSLIGVEKSVLYLVGELDGALSVAACSTPTADGHPMDTDGSRILEEILVHAAKTGRMIKINDVLKSPSLLAKAGQTLHENSIRSFLAMPIFDNESKVIGLLQCVNKQNNTEFNADDVDMVALIASHVALTLEGEGSSMKQILRTVKSQMRKRAITGGESVQVGHDLDKMNVVCFAHRASGLPSKQTILQKFAPYLTLEIVRGDPLTKQCDTGANGVYDNRQQHTTVKSGVDPTWNEHVYLSIPPGVDAHTIDEFYVHIKLWNYDYVKENDLIGQMVYPLARIIKPSSECKEDDEEEDRSFPILATGKQAKVDMSNAKLHITFRTEQKDEQQRAHGTIDRRVTTVLRFMPTSWKRRSSAPDKRSDDP